MKLFVTGGTGFVGSHFLNQALAGGHEVVASRRSPSSQPRVLVKVPKETRRSPLRWLDISMPDISELELEGCDALLHLAAVGITPQPATWEECFAFNVIQTLALFRRAVSAGIRRIVVTGSYAEYGLAGLRFDPIPPDAPLEPTDPYAASKAAASVALTALCRVAKFELVYFRVFSIFGEGQHEKNFWPQLRRAALAGEDFPMTEGSQVRDYLPVEAAAAILLKAATQAEVAPGIPSVCNLASGQPVTIREFAEFWWEKWGAIGKLKFGEIPYREGEVMRYVPQLTL